MSEYVSDLRQIRNESREQDRLSRLRCAIDGSRRGLPHSDMRYSTDAVDSMVSKLKAKTINDEEMTTLMYALSESEDNVSAFFNIPGALQSLIREFTCIDQNPSRQLLAIGSLCNLACGPPRSCLTIAKSIGAYIITFLQSRNVHLVELCCWTLGNLISSGEKVADTLKDLDLYNQLLPLLKNEYEPKVVDAAAYAISHMLSSKTNCLTPAQIEEITQNVITRNSQSDQLFWLLYLLTDNPAAQRVFLSNFTLNHSLKLLVEIVVHNPTLSDLIGINCLVRIVANLCCEESLNRADNLEIVYSDLFVAVMRSLLSCGRREIQNETMWLLGNVYRFTNDCVEKQILFNAISNEE